MLGNESQDSPAPNTNKREQVSHKITQLVDNLPLFPTDINQLLSSAVKPTEGGTEILRLIESDPKLRSQLLSLARSYFGRAEDFVSIEDAVQHVGVRPLVQLIGISYAREAIQQEFAALKYLNDYVNHSEDITSQPIFWAGYAHCRESSGRYTPWPGSSTMWAGWH